MILGGEFTKDLFLILICLNGFLSKNMATSWDWDCVHQWFPHMFLFSYPTKDL